MNKNNVLFLILVYFLSCCFHHEMSAEEEVGDEDAVESNQNDESDNQESSDQESDNQESSDQESEEYNDPANDIVEQLVLVEEGINQVLAILEKLTGKTVLKEKIPDAKISLEIQQPMTRAEAILAIESILALNNVATIDMGDGFIKAVVAKNTSSHAPELVDESLRDVVASQKAYSKFFTLKHLDAGEFNKLIKPIITNSLSQVIHFQSSNSLLVVDTLANLQRIEEVVKRVDVPMDIKEEMYFHVLSNVKSRSGGKMHQGYM